MRYDREKNRVAAFQPQVKPWRKFFPTDVYGFMDPQDLQDEIHKPPLDHPQGLSTLELMGGETTTETALLCCLVGVALNEPVHGFSLLL
ncbi:MAG: hypothetical protein HC767_00050 [Akkermansiaceae bacterium]|nr:hypothetical protein [Akkermansiaceae bacterium]